MILGPFEKIIFWVGPPRNAVAAILDFTDEEWESLKALKEANAGERSPAAVANDIDNNSGALGMENEMIGGTIDKGKA
jgi:hypothetical protein